MGVELGIDVVRWNYSCASESDRIRGANELGTLWPVSISYCTSSEAPVIKLIETAQHEHKYKKEKQKKKKNKQFTY